MPATSEKQRKFMGAVYSYKKNKKKKVSKKIKDAAKSMTLKEVKDFLKMPKKKVSKSFDKASLDSILSLANDLDKKGLYKEADLLDSVLNKILKLY